MVKGMSLIALLSCIIGFSQAIHAILVEGSTWTLLGKKEIVFLFEIHDQPEFEEQESAELEQVVIAIKKYLDNKNGKPLHLLVEDLYDPLGVLCVLNGLRKRLEEEKLLSQVTFETIEMRGASASAGDLLENYPKEVRYPRISTTGTFYPDQITLQNVLDEFDTTIAKLQHELAFRTAQFQELHSAEFEYSEVAQKLKEIHDEKMDILNEYRATCEGIIKDTKISCNKPLLSVLQSSPENLALYKSLKDPLFKAASSLVDLNLFYRVLAIPEGEKILCIAGGRHCSYVKSRIMGRLGAKRTCLFGNYGSGFLPEDASFTPLSLKQLEALVCP